MRTTALIVRVAAFCWLPSLLACGSDGQDQRKCGATELRAKLQAIAARADGSVGLAAEVVETGERIDLNGAEQFPMQGVYKLPIVMASLAQVDGGRHIGGN
ncbi:MAG TPA: serine hydrolase [Candidatus Methylomirabilis sp.]|nr:serine hydrolase [Candidatus Methylomirabilis sp.]